MHRFYFSYRLLYTPLLLLLCMIAVAVTACRSKEQQESVPGAHDELMRVGDSVLTRAAVNAQIPAGLSATDSATMFDAIVETWLERNLLVNMAGSNIPDLEKIDRMVEQYRLQLLANEYRHAMAREQVSAINPDSIKAYYNAHSEQFILDAPALKGIYLKLPEGAPQLDKVRAWLRGATSDDIDALENDGLKGALEYDYFGDNWVDWHAISERIPYRFGNADEFVASHTMFETSADGAVYLLRILDYAPSGELMPLEFATVEISEQMLDRKCADYDRTLLSNLYKRGLQQKLVVTGSYIPKKYR